VFLRWIYTGPSELDPLTCGNGTRKSDPLVGKCLDFV